MVTGRHPRSRIWFVLLGGMALAGPRPAASAAPEFCDSALIAAVAASKQCEASKPCYDYTAYPVGPRCEGRYPQKVSSEPPGFDLVSFASVDLPDKWLPTAMISVALANDSKDPLRLRGSSILGATYRLDAELAYNKPLEWPVADVILPTRQQPYDFGLFAFHAVGNRADYYMPVKVTIKGAPPPQSNPPIKVIVRPRIPVTKPQWAVQGSHCDPASPAQVQDFQEIADRPVLSKSPISLPLSQPQPASVQCLTVRSVEQNAFETLELHW